MLHSFSCKNFYSFAGDTLVSFAVNDKAPQNDAYFETPSQIRLSKVEAVVGPNASGKTNLLKVLPFLKWLIIDSFKSNPTSPLPVKKFILENNKNKPTELAVTFEIEQDVFCYKFELFEEKILSELLQVTNKTKQKVTSKILFKRSWDEETNKYLFTGDKFELPKNFEGLLRKNASVIGTAMLLNHKLSLKIAQYWQKVETNVVEAGWIGDHLFPNPMQNLAEAMNFYVENETLKKEAEKLLARFDLGLEAFEIKKEEKEGGATLSVQGIHIFGKKKCTLPLSYESAGTKQLFVLLKTILTVLANGGIAVLDEFDVNLHPEIVMALYELFVSPETNSKNAQMILSSHSHRILGILDKYQIILTEKNDNGSSEAWRLDEMENVRADENYYSKYIAGAYGAIPRIN